MTPNAGDIRDVGSIPGLGRAPGGGHGNPLQCSCLENPMDKGARWSTIHKITKSLTRLKQLSSSSFTGFVQMPHPHQSTGNSLKGGPDIIFIKILRALSSHDSNHLGKCLLDEM